MLGSEVISLIKLCDHDNILRYYENFYDDDHHSLCIVTEYCEVFFV